jgi:predicted  nucleic acid-binding Zn-ribbon protein
MTSDLQKEIASLENQIDFQEKKLDMVLKNDLQLKEAKKLLHEIKILKAKLTELNQINLSF